DARRGALRLLRFPVLRPYAPSRGAPQRPDARHQSGGAAPGTAEDVPCAGPGKPRGGVGGGRVTTRAGYFSTLSFFVKSTSIWAPALTATSRVSVTVRPFFCHWARTS